jgi:osmotically-inducible protein OsmY
MGATRDVRAAVEAELGFDPLVHVRQALDRSALVPDGSDVTADTKDGIITLTGHVRTWAEHDAVVGAAWMARGAADVRDELQVTG